MCDQIMLIADPANDLQAMDRAFRIGQQRTVEVYRLIGLGTLEELKYERQSGWSVIQSRDIDADWQFTNSNAHAS